MLTHEQIEELLGEPCPLDHRVTSRAHKWEPAFEETPALAFLATVGRWHDIGFEMNFQRVDFEPEPGERKRFRLLRSWPEYTDPKAVSLGLGTGVFGSTSSKTVALVYGLDPDEIQSADNPSAPVDDPADDPVYAELAEMLGTSHENAYHRATNPDVIEHFARILARKVIKSVAISEIYQKYDMNHAILRAALRQELAESASAYHAQANALADLVIDKQAQYGDSFGRSGAILQVLYPDGIPVEAYTSALTLIRVIDKLFRLATHSEDTTGENPWRDIANYALLMIARP